MMRKPKSGIVFGGMGLVCGLLCGALTGCDYIARRTADPERADRMYRAAMEEIAAGRIDKAVAGLQKVLSLHPENASARFQLACLLQEKSGDYLGALCQYREYMALDPKGDKKSLAERRAADCERALMRTLAEKAGAGGSASMATDNARLRTENAALRTQSEKNAKELEKLKEDFAALRRENDRLRRMTLAAGEDDEAPAARQASAKKGMPAIPSEKELTAEDDVGGIDRVKLSQDVDSLIAEEKTEHVGSPFGATVKPAETVAPAPEEPPHEPRPKKYIVQEGDTLMKLAVRFYGRKSAWISIRNNNKATVSTDGRIRAGQELVFP